MDENLFVKFLELSKYSDTNILYIILSRMDLQLFKEVNDNVTYTLSGTNFVLDFSNDTNINLYFIEEEYNDKFQYVIYYLKSMIENKEYKMLYLFLKYFCAYDNYDGSNNTQDKECRIKIIHELYYCSCIETGNYCNILSYKDCYLLDNYNIFVHGKNIDELDFKFTRLVGDLDVKYILHSDFVEFNVDSNVINISKDLKVYVNELYKPELSFLVRNGISWSRIKEINDILSNK